ncbi:MAG: flavin reductase family protein [Armatimonadetes bacterium]|nr:flavin reductase family protein [Armatimonadota bacterium]
MLVRTFVPSEMSPREAYALLISCVAPRPIAWVSTCAPDGRVNLAPFSFFNAGGANPVSVVFSCTNFRDGRPKDTLRNVHATGEFVVNIAPYWLAEQMNQTSFEYEYGVSEFEQVGLTRAPSLYVQPPRVAESPIAMECKLFQVVAHGAGAVAANYVIGEVLCFHIAETLLAPGGVVDNLVADYIGRMGESWYVRATPEAMFRLQRPTGK